MRKRRSRIGDKDPSQGGRRSAAFEVLERPLSQAAKGSPFSLQEEASPFASDGSASAPCGSEIIAKTAQSLTSGPGVYRMLDAKNNVLYVGKAKNLPRRLQAYTRLRALPVRLRRMVRLVAGVEIGKTKSEVSALLLEANLIKRFSPPFNVLLRDDKSLPYILLEKGHDFPRLHRHRGIQNKEGDYFGPFASSSAVHKTLKSLEQIFLLRSCTDHVFRQRTRPCLLHQIKRCSAPCVGRIDKESYRKLVLAARKFLAGRSQEVQKNLADEMQLAASRRAYERAATLRDRLQAATHLQARQEIHVEGLEDTDVIAIAQSSGQTCVQVVFYRAGRNCGGKAYFLRHAACTSQTVLCAAFLGQFYEDKPPPAEVLVNAEPQGKALLVSALRARSGHALRLYMPQRGLRANLLAQAADNAREALARRVAYAGGGDTRNLNRLATLLELTSSLERVEVYDNSHLQGSNPYGAMVVFGEEGFVKSAYRKFHIRGAGVTGNDHAMLSEVLRRRFRNHVAGGALGSGAACASDSDRRGVLPDLLLVDGGRGHLHTARGVVVSLGLPHIPIAAIAKGKERHAGREKIYVEGKSAIALPLDDARLYFVQRLRDEAHRFAIHTHRQGRRKSQVRSVLDRIPGIGPHRKKQLLLHFGSPRAVAAASEEDLLAVQGVSRRTAEAIFAHFHGPASKLP